jgi:hypothetical protein
MLDNSAVKRRFRQTAEVAAAREIGVGDRFQESARPDRRFELVRLIRPSSGLIHGHLRNMDKPHEMHLISLRTLREGKLYKPVRIGRHNPSVRPPPRP